MKSFMRVFVLAMLLMAMCAASAGAVTYNKIANMDLSFELPVGLDADVQYNEEDALLSIDIDCDHTDWALLAASVTGMKEVRISYHVKNSQLMRTDSRLCVLDQKNADIMNAPMGLKEWAADMYSNMQEAKKTMPPEVFKGPYGLRDGYTNMISLFDYNEENETLIPKDYRNSTLFIGVMNTDENLTDYSVRYTRVEISFSSYGTQKADASMPATSVIPDNRVSTDDGEDYHLSAGRLVYALKNDTSYKSLDTGVKVPTGAKSLMLRIGSGGEPAHIDAEGKTSVTIGAAVPVADDSQDIIIANLIWYDGKLEEGKATGTPVSAQRLVIEVKKGVPMPYPHYFTDAQAISASRIEMGEMKNGKNFDIPFIDYEFNDTRDNNIEIKINKKKDAKPTANIDLTNAYLSVTIQKPENAKRFRYAPSSGSEVYGLRSVSADMYNEQIIILGGEPWQSISGNTVTLQESRMWNLFTLRERYDDPGLKIFYGNETEEGGANIVFIEWEMEDGTTKKEWLSFHIDRISFVQDGEVADTMPESEVDRTTLVPENMRNRNVTNLKLAVDTQPQLSAAGNQVQYDVSLVDADGNAAKFGDYMKSAKLIFPVPEGATEDMNIVINHYEKEDSLSANETLSTADGSLEWTEAGLVGTVKSLSPFIISWGYEDVAGVENLPDTGDDSMPLAVLIAMAVSSMAALLLMRRKHVKQN